jgi:hypothetical protein
MVVRLVVMSDAVFTTMQEVTLADPILFGMIAGLRSDVSPSM